MFELETLVRPNVRKLIPYSCARDDYHGREGIFLDANENPFGTLNRYPDPYQQELKAAVSKIKGIPVEKIFLGNGSDEIIDLCFRIFCRPGKDRALTFYPSYGMYEVSASANDVQMIRIALDENFQIDFSGLKSWLSDKNLKLILICSPNNPTGNCMKRSVVEKIIKSFKGIVLVDEAYIDFAGEKSLKNAIGRYPNLIVMQTFSKAYGMASVRIGTAFASPEIVHYFNKMKPPYNISTINQKTVLQRLRKPYIFKDQVSRIISERKRLSGELKKLAITRQVYPSDANFILVKVNNACKIYDLLVNSGIVVRNRSNVADNCLRITVGTKAENNKLLKSLKAIEL
jgi:histidinol-phosphate aminotransferase